MTRTESISKTALAIAVVGITLSQSAVAQQATPAATTECSVDLSLPGQMADVLSNALMQHFDKDETTVITFLDDASDKFESGDDVLRAVSQHFKISETALKAAAEQFRHINCAHEGGGEAVISDGSVSPFAEKVLTHVALHELGHALVREFDLPVLGNEETMADAFATHYVVTYLPDEAFGIIEARCLSWMIEAAEVPQAEWSVQGEHNSDARRAYQCVALAIAADPQKYEPLAKIVEMSDSKARSAADYGSEIHRSWRRLLRPLQMPPGSQSSEARMVIQDDSVFAESLEGSGLSRKLKTAVRSFDWHSHVTLRFAGGKGGAAWSRSSRTVTIQDGYIQRFNDQGTKVAASPQE